RQSAIIAGVGQELGTLAPGKLADMVVIDGDPLRDIAELDRVEMTISNGHRYPLDLLLANPEG
ncbi:MAG: amidohydrolase family protein, partial [Chromatocurvus sp.]